MAACVGAMAMACAGEAGGASSPSVITVVAGKPTELAFTLSRFSALPPGPFVFRIRNAGASPHDFVLCEDPVRSAAQNACVGYRSRELLPGQATTIRIGAIRKGIYEFLSADPGDAAGGMKGLLGVGVAVKHAHLKKPAARRPAPRTPAPPEGGSTTTTTPTSTAPMTTAPTGPYTCRESDGSIQQVASPGLCSGTLVNPNG